MQKLEEAGGAKGLSQAAGNGGLFFSIYLYLYRHVYKHLVKYR
jgi:hypothetical protein